MQLQKYQIQEQGKVAIVVKVTNFRMIFITFMATLGAALQEKGEPSFTTHTKKGATPSSNNTSHYGPKHLHSFIKTNALTNKCINQQQTNTLKIARHTITNHSIQAHHDS